MRIVIFHPDGHPTFRPDLSVLFGKYMADSGIVTDIVSHATGSAENAKEWHGSRFYLAKGGRLSRLVFILRYALFLSLRDYDAVIARDMPIVAWLIMLRAWFTRKTFLYWRSFPIAPMDLVILKQNWHEINWSRRFWLALKGGIGTKLERIMIANSMPAHVFVQSRSMAVEVEGWGANPKTVTAVPMCVDPERFPEPVVENKPSVQRVTYVGTCDRARRIDVLIGMIEELHRRGSKVELLIVGDAHEPPDKEWIRAMIRQSPASAKITITGWVSTKEVSGYLNRSKIAVSLMPVDSIYRTTSPTKLVEYMASAIPVIVNDHPDQTELVTNSKGGIVSPFNAEALASCVEKILHGEYDATVMGLAGRSYILTHRNYAHMAAQVAMVIKNAI